MKIEFPWAKRNHCHADFAFLKYGVCSGCGHLVLMGQVRNKYVQVMNRVKGLEFNEIYGESCAPNYDLKEIGLDGEVKYYKKGVRTGIQGE